MPDLSIYFTDFPPLQIILDDNNVARQWKKLFNDNYNQQMPICRSGKKKYTLAYLNELVSEANEKLSWNYSTNISSCDDTVILHKNIEQICIEGFQNIPAKHDNLIHEIHFCIHAVESSGKLAPILNPNLVAPSGPQSSSFLQIEWYNDDGFALDESFDFKLNLEVGDIKLQNPFVGHGPLQIYRFNDYSNVFQTCKFHNFVRPGINLMTKVRDNTDILDGSYNKWWQKNAPEFVAKHGMEKIWHYTGHPVIGRTINVSDAVELGNSVDDVFFEKVVIH